MSWIFHIGIAQSFFSAFLLFTKRTNTLSDRILGYWMIFIGLELLHMLFEIMDSGLHLYTSNFGFYSLTFGPFLFLYVSKLTQENARFTTGDLLHFLPYLVFSLIHLFFFTNRALLLGELEFDQGWFVLVMLRVVSLFLSFSIYSFLALKQIAIHRKSIRDTYSFESSRITLQWLTHIIVIFIVTYVLLIINNLSGNIAQLFFHTAHLIPAIGLTFFCFSLSYYGFNQPVLFQKSAVEKVAGGAEEQDLAPGQRKAHLNKLHKYLKEEKPYLNPELTISELADLIKIPRSYLTEVLKHELDKNFFMLIQDYRIEEVKRKLKDPLLSQEPVLQIALGCGFNSKSSFNALFKQYTGTTPSQFRKDQENEKGKP
jgi:AraC-like DNA-binding protein